MAVELAKLALWLETVAIDAPLAFLDHHLQAGDSLVGARIERLDSLTGRALIEGTFREEIAQALPSLLEPLEEIGKLPSTSVDEVRRKEQLFTRRFRVAEQRFQAVGDIWCAAAMKLLPDSTGPDQYASAIQTLLDKRRTASQTPPLAETARRVLADHDLTCFQWELAFPEVFLDQRRPRGFDVVIGNPPYDVLAEREAGPRVTYLKSFIAQDPSLSASVVGKNNLYKLFICRALEVARDGGRVSFIVPMSLLGDDQSSGVRTLLLGSGAFMEIHSFPQKDNPHRRVFRDAKLSTALFTFQKGPIEGEPTPFPSVRHPANLIEENSPSMLVRTNEIGLYDPGNAAIVSCSQQDWDLATRLGKHPSFTRLGNLCKSY